MIRARPTGWFSWDYRLHDGEREVAFLDVAVLREGADVSIGGVPFRFSREGLAGDFTLAFEDTVIARATKRTVLGSTFHVRLEDAAATRLVLKRKSLVSDRFEVFEDAEDGPLLGAIYKTSMWTRKARIDLPDSVELGVQVFLFWLAVIMWRRSNRAS
jgi:hypothetical protein